MHPWRHIVAVTEIVALQWNPGTVQRIRNVNGAANGGFVVSAKKISLFLLCARWEPTFQELQICLESIAASVIAAVFTWFSGSITNVKNSVLPEV